MTDLEHVSVSSLRVHQLLVDAGAMSLGKYGIVGRYRIDVIVAHSLWG